MGKRKLEEVISSRSARRDLYYLPQKQSPTLVFSCLFLIKYLGCKVYKTPLLLTYSVSNRGDYTSGRCRTIGPVDRVIDVRQIFYLISAFCLTAKIRH